MIRRPPRSTQSRSSAASDVYRQDTWNRPLHSDRNPHRDPSARRCSLPLPGRPASPDPSLLGSVLPALLVPRSLQIPPLRVALAAAAQKDRTINPQRIPAFPERLYSSSHLSQTVCPRTNRPERPLPIHPSTPL